ncbi:MAG TPA: hypothetical protein VHC20_08160 [Candidatus Paceibacterota bacterium]|nr:hypothetical protein [Candidatus Paceibacterota bacterium]
MNDNDDLPEADALGHRTRYSDSSLYDEKCVLCGATDMRGATGLSKPCPNKDDKKRRY